MAHRIARTDGVVDSNALTGAEAIPWLILTQDCAAAPQGGQRALQLPLDDENGGRLETRSRRSYTFAAI